MRVKCLQQFAYQTDCHHPQNAASRPTSVPTGIHRPGDEPRVRAGTPRQGSGGHEPETCLTVTIRKMRPADQPQAEALWKGLSPYRPGDEPEVEAMYERALRARDAGDSRWKSLEASCGMESDDLPAELPGELGGRRAVR